MSPPEKPGTIQVDTAGMREWAVGQIEAWELSGEGTILVSQGTAWDARFPRPSPKLEARKEYLERTLDWARSLARALWTMALRTNEQLAQTQPGFPEHDEVMELLRGRWDISLDPSQPPNPPSEPEATPSNKHLEKSQRGISEHCEWLARYQVDRESFREIADSVGVQRQSITEAIKEVALLLNLRLRPPTRGGRPKK